MLLKKKRINKDIERKKYTEITENRNNFWKCMRPSKSSSKREIYSKTGLHQETRKISSKPSNFAPRRVRETLSY